LKTESVVKDFPIVCVGGSAGGLDAYTRLLRHLPADMGVAIVIVNHLRTVATMLHEILPRYTEMPVELITERLIIQPDHVFIIPEQCDLHVLDGEFEHYRLTGDKKIKLDCPLPFIASLNILRFRHILRPTESFRTFCCPLLINLTPCC
jgi:chemotaxis response regulator CheB